MAIIKNKIKSLREKDTYSLLLFTLYKCMNVPEYSSISELSYVLDKQNFLNLCEYFGGQTITIPTTREIKLLTYSLLLYQYVNVDKMSYESAIQLIDCCSSDLREVKKGYQNICKVLENYTFSAREVNE